MIKYALKLLQSEKQLQSSSSEGKLLKVDKNVVDVVIRLLGVVLRRSSNKRERGPVKSTFNWEGGVLGSGPFCLEVACYFSHWLNQK